MKRAANATARFRCLVPLTFKTVTAGEAGQSLPRISLEPPGTNAPVPMTKRQPNLYFLKMDVSHCSKGATLN